MTEKKFVLPPEVEAELAKQEVFPYDWLRRFAQGGRDKRNPDCFTYSLPGKERRDGIIRVLESLDAYPWVVLHEHRRSLEAAQRLMRINGYDLDGDAHFGGGRLRGIYLGTVDLDRVVVESCVIANYVPGEEAIRVREIRFRYNNYSHEAVGDLRTRFKEARPHERVVRDGWAVAGHLKGRVFNLEDRRSLPVSYPLFDFALNTKGDRISRFTAAAPHDRQDAITYTRCEDEETFDRVMLMLNAIKKPKSLPVYSDLALA